MKRAQNVSFSRTTKIVCGRYEWSNNSAKNGTSLHKRGDREHRTSTECNGSLAFPLPLQKWNSYK